MSISSCNFNESHSVDVLAIGYVLPVLYENILQILKALLTWYAFDKLLIPNILMLKCYSWTSCKQNFIIFSRLVNRIVISTFDWLDKMNSIEKKLYLDLRSSIYLFIEILFSTLGKKSSFSNSELHSLTKHLVANVRILESNLTVIIYKQCTILIYNGSLLINCSFRIAQSLKLLFQIMLILIKIFL